MEGHPEQLHVVNNVVFDPHDNAHPSPAAAPVPARHLMRFSSTTSNIGDASMTSTVCMAGDEYAFYRSWLRDQVGKDPELSAQWVQWEAQGLISPRAPSSKHTPAPWGDTPTANPYGSSSGSSSSSNTCASAGTVVPPPPHLHIHLQHQQCHRRGEPDLREQIARQLAASQGPGHDPQAVAAAGAERCQPWQGAAAGSGAGGCSSNSGSSHKGGRYDSPRSKADSKGGGSSADSSPTRRAELSRTQLKAVRKLFPIRAPSLKPAAALQGAYQLLDIIGKGAFGCAYKARHLPTGRLVCIKTLEAPTGKHQEEELTKQRREVAVLAALALHPNIIRYLECFADNGKLQLVMEWADGGDLDSLIQRHAKARTYMSEEQLLGYFVQLIAALAHVHGLGIMHRDIKSNNIFLTSQGLLKLGDFGISKVVDAPGTSSNSGSGGKGNSTGTSSSGISIHPSRGVLAHSFVGTPNYLAPEMVACEGYGFKADIWAAGCVLYEMAALKPAFRAKQISIIYHLIRRGKTSPLPNMYSKELQVLQRRMMARDPADRPCCAELMQDELLRPHFARYYTLLSQLKLELPRLPSDLPFGSSSGTLRTAALLTSGRRTSSGGSSTRNSMDAAIDWSWARRGFKNTTSRDSAEFKRGRLSKDEAADYKLSIRNALMTNFLASKPQQEKQQGGFQQQQQHAHCTAPSTGSSPPLTASQSVRTTQDAPAVAAAGGGLGQPVLRQLTDSSRSSEEGVHPGPAAAAAADKTSNTTALLSPTSTDSKSSSSGLISVSSGAAADISGGCSGSTSADDGHTTAAAATAAAAAGGHSWPQPAKPAPLHLEHLTDSAHVSSSSSVVEAASSSSAVGQGDAVVPGVFQEAPVVLSDIVINAEGYQHNEHLSWLEMQCQQHEQQQQTGFAQAAAAAAPGGKKGMLHKMQKSWNALWGAAAAGKPRRSRLGVSALMASGLVDRSNRGDKSHHSDKSPRSERPRKKRKSGLFSTGSAEGCSEGGEGMIPAGRLGPEAAVEEFTPRSWADMLREAGITALNQADAELLQQAGVLWDESSRGSSQRSSLEKRGDSSPQRRSLQLSTATDSSRSTCEALPSNGKAAPRMGGSLDLPQPISGSKPGSIVSLSSWFGRQSIEQQRPQMAQPPAAVAVSGQQPTAAAPAAAVETHAALPVPQSATGSLLLTQQIQQLRDLAAAIGHGPLFGSLSTITEGSEGSRLASRRGSGTTQHSPRGVPSARGSLEAKSPQSREGGGNRPALSPLSAAWRGSEGQLSTVPEADAEATPKASFAAAIAVAVAADSFSVIDALMREQLNMCAGIQQLQAMLKSPLDCSSRSSEAVAKRHVLA